MRWEAWVQPAVWTWWELLDSHKGRHVLAKPRDVQPPWVLVVAAAWGKTLAPEKGQQAPSLPSCNDLLSIKSWAKGNLDIYISRLPGFPVIASCC